MKKTNKLLYVLIVIVFFGIAHYYLNNMVTEGYYTIKENNILAENGAYYLFLEGKKIEVSEDLFNQLEINNRYHIKYSWNKILRNQGKIEELNLDKP